LLKNGPGSGTGIWCKLYTRSGKKPRGEDVVEKELERPGRKFMRTGRAGSVDLLEESLKRSWL
jgi:hypothetical protein